MSDFWQDSIHISTYDAGIVHLSVEEVDGGWKASAEGSHRYTSAIIFPDRETAKQVAAMMALMKLNEAETGIVLLDWTSVAGEGGGE